MKWEYRRFKTYGEFIAFLNKMNDLDSTWNLHSWQDVKSGSYQGTDIRAIFTQVLWAPDSGIKQGPLPEA